MPDIKSQSNRTEGSRTDTSSETTPKSGIAVEPSPMKPHKSTLEWREQNKAKLDAAKERRQAAIAKFLSQSREEQRKLVEDKWALLCYELVQKAQKYSQSVSEKDFGKLSQLITAAAISKDKVFHRDDAQKPGNVVFNLFGNVGLEHIKRMLQPAPPTIINAKEIVHEESQPVSPQPAPIDGVQCDEVREAS